ncbi:hypothetical protein [Maribacter sp. ACAM166]|uniref:hypothetical protein n=1 Tax=Maribacter sp. ACAM166 TaxID=2508996 RepID=UPI0010FD16BC|nr:hypothetical protein [Maribacter sp. ACAM166]TLP81777.1 hypothetical protein ES765_03590 [Maribacter sp. ACAM166]
MKKIKSDFILKKPNILLLPLVGMALFVALYLLAAFTYPGGSWVFPNKDGFSFWHNYLCDLLDIYAINGEVNSARAYSIAALGLLCMGLFWLWYYLPKLFNTKSLNQKVMRVSGLLSLLIILFLASGNHDKIVRIAGFFGVIAFITCSIELFKSGYKTLFLFGVLCLLVFMVNYYIYETGLFISSLPVIQKITFTLFISWFIGLDVALYRKVLVRKKLSAMETP